MSIHSIYLVSDLEGSDNGDPIYGINRRQLQIHGLVTVQYKWSGTVPYKYGCYVFSIYSFLTIMASPN